MSGTRVKGQTPRGESKGEAPMSNWQEHPWMGVFPATLCPFHEDESLDEAELAHLTATLRRIRLNDQLATACVGPCKRTASNRLDDRH